MANGGWRANRRRKHINRQKEVPGPCGACNSTATSGRGHYLPCPGSAHRALPSVPTPRCSSLPSQCLISTGRLCTICRCAIGLSERGRLACLRILYYTSSSTRTDNTYLTRKHYTPDIWETNGATSHDHGPFSYKQAFGLIFDERNFLSWTGCHNWEPNSFVIGDNTIDPFLSIVSAEWVKSSESRLVWLSVNIDIDPSTCPRFWSQYYFHNVNEMDHDRDVITRPKTPYVVSCYDQCHRLPLKSIVCHFSRHLPLTSMESRRRH